MSYKKEISVYVNGVCIGYCATVSLTTGSYTLAELQFSLSSALEEERYEDAAIIRDQIKELEEQKA